MAYPEREERGEGGLLLKPVKASIYTKILIPALMIYALIGFFSTRAKIARAEELRQEKQAEAQALEEENEYLRYAIEHADDPAVIEDVARSELGLVMPGEKLFYDIGN